MYCRNINRKQRCVARGTGTEPFMQHRPFCLVAVVVVIVVVAVVVVLVVVVVAATVAVLASLLKLFLFGCVHGCDKHSVNGV